MSVSTLISVAAAADFLFTEARLLDSHDYDGWLELWDEHGYYWIPADGGTDPDRHVSLVYDTTRRLALRVAQLQTGYRHAQLPQSTTQHYITNVQVADGPGDGLVEVRSSYLVIEARFGQLHLWPGRATHELRVGSGDALRILRKTVVLINNDMPVTSMAFLL